MTKKSFSHTEIREKLQEDRNKTKGKGRVKFNDLDPMDPASYSDIPRYTLISYVIIPVKDVPLFTILSV